MNKPETTAERILEWSSVTVLRTEVGEIPIADLQTLAREYLKGRWVPCEERLPDEDGYYLTFLDVGIQKIIRFVDGAWNIDFYRVTHYRPLPDDPDEDPGK